MERNFFEKERNFFEKERNFEDLVQLVILFEMKIERNFFEKERNFFEKERNFENCLCCFFGGFLVKYLIVFAGEVLKLVGWSEFSKWSCKKGCVIYVLGVNILADEAPHTRRRERAAPSSAARNAFARGGQTLDRLWRAFCGEEMR